MLYQRADVVNGTEDSNKEAYKLQILRLIINLLPLAGNAAGVKMLQSTGLDSSSLQPRANLFEALCFLPHGRRASPAARLLAQRPVNGGQSVEGPFSLYM